MTIDEIVQEMLRDKVITSSLTDYTRRQITAAVEYAIQEERQARQAAEAQVEILREALQPFAKEAEEIDGDCRKNGVPLPPDVGHTGVRIGYCRRAAEALQSLETKEIIEDGRCVCPESC